MKHSVKAGIAALAVGVWVAGCSSAPSVEDRVNAACLKVLENKGARHLDGPPNDSGIGFEWDSSAITVTDLDFSNVEVKPPESSDHRSTKTWTVTGTITAHRVQETAPGEWDDDGQPNQVPDLIEDFQCSVGYRESDDAVVVFEYQLLHIRDGKQSGNTYTDTLVSMQPAEPSSPTATR